jgi:membrane associated rhomboid family serine protease
MSSPGAAAPPAGRLREFFGSLPLVTLCLTGLCVLVFVLDTCVFDFSESLSASSMSPATVAGGLELYRLVTAAFTHGSVMHIGMNMVSFVSLASSLEGLFGSLGFAFLVSAYVLLVGALFIALGALASALERAFWWQSAVGFSGVIFALAVDECALSPAPSRSVFGLFSVPTRWYPWVLMGALQLLLPNVSFLGHLAGVLAGLAHAAGALRVALPAPATLRKIETLWLPAALVRSAAYRLAPQAEPVVVQSLLPEGALRALRACAAGAAAAAARARAAAGAFAPLPEGAASAQPQAAAQTSFGSGRLGGAQPPQPAGASSSSSSSSSSAGAAAPRAEDSALPAAAAAAARASAFGGDDSRDGAQGAREADAEEHPEAPLLAASTAAGGAQPALSDAERAARAAKAAAAAEARAAAAAAVGRPSLVSQV